MTDCITFLLGSIISHLLRSTDSFYQSHFCCCPYSVTKSHLTLLWPHGLKRPVSVLCSCNFLGKNPRVGCHFLLQRFFQPRDWTHVSCVAGGFLTTEPPGNPITFLPVALTIDKMVPLLMCFVSKPFFHADLTSYIIRGSTWFS